MQELLRVEIGFSHLLVCYLCLLHLAALVSLCLLPLPGWAWLSAVAALCVSGWCYQCRFNGSGTAILTTIIISDEQCRLIYKNGESRGGVLIRRQFVSAYLILLHLRISGSMRSKRVMLWRDALDRDCYRRLKVKLRYS